MTSTLHYFIDILNIKSKCDGEKSLVTKYCCHNYVFGNIFDLFWSETRNSPQPPSPSSNLWARKTPVRLQEMYAVKHLYSLVLWKS